MLRNALSTGLWAHARRLAVSSTKSDDRSFTGCGRAGGCHLCPGCPYRLIPPPSTSSIPTPDCDSTTPQPGRQTDLEAVLSNSWVLWHNVILGVSGIPLTYITSCGLCKSCAHGCGRPTFRWGRKWHEAKRPQPLRVASSTASPMGIGQISPGAGAPLPNRRDQNTTPVATNTAVS
jgi:hypothetical protein